MSCVRPESRLTRVRVSERERDRGTEKECAGERARGCVSEQAHLRKLRSEGARETET